MNCFNHPNHVSVAQCADCGKGLCQRCANKYHFPICDSCYNQRKRANFAQYLKPFVICTLLFVIGYHSGIFGEYDQLFGAYMVACAYGGWKFVNQCLPNLFVVFEMKAIIMFYIVKFVVSMLIGFFVTPFYLLYCLYHLIRLIK